MADLVSCPRCNASSYKAGARFCSKCGAELFPRTKRTGRALVFTLLGFVWKCVRLILCAIVAFLGVLLASRGSAETGSERAQQALMCPNCGGRMNTFGIRSVCSVCAKELVHPWRR